MSILRAVGLLLCLPAVAADWGLRWQGGKGDSLFVASCYGADPPARPQEGAPAFLRLLSGVPNQQNVVAFAAPPGQAYAVVRATWEMRIEPGADGYAFALLAAEHFGREGAGPRLTAWEEPNLPGSFAVAFDIYDPPTEDRFGANGNIHGRPERQISLHVDGVERENRLSPVEFRDGAFHQVALTLTFAAGGADVSVLIDGVAVYDQVFVPGLIPYSGRACFGARSGGQSTVLDLRGINLVWSGPTAVPGRPVTVQAFDSELVEWAEPYRHTVRFPSTEAGRIVLRYRLSKPELGWDPWDRKAALRVRTPVGRWIEIARVITPYAREWEWYADVTPYQSLLRGDVEVEAFIETWGGKGKGKGFVLSVACDVYEGPCVRRPLAVVPLWQGDVEIGNPEKPAEAFFVPMVVSVPEKTVAATVRLTVTGHGMNPNSGNAAEFLPLGRRLAINGTVFENRLWRTDCWLNPCRPQGGTWKYDRAGWAPGAVVRPWDVDVPAAALRSGSLRLGYRIDPYMNENRGKTHPPRHWVEGQVIFFAE